MPLFQDDALLPCYSLSAFSLPTPPIDGSFAMTTRKRKEKSNVADT
jgi:hypothetical protein